MKKVPVATALTQLRVAVHHGNAFYRNKWAADSGTALVRKADFVADQEAHPPYGTNLTFPLDRYTRVHQTSGTTTGRPLRWLDTPESWSAILDNWDHIFRAAGLGPHEVVYFPFSFGPFIGFWAGFDACARAGHRAIPGGGLSSSARLRSIHDHAATVVCCTPTYALHLAEVARHDGIDLSASPVRHLFLAGEPGGQIPETRAAIESAWGAAVTDHYGLTETGPVAVEFRDAPGGLSVLPDHVIEVIDPATTEPVGPGEVGELVVTNLRRIGSPAIRYRTGDLVQLDPEPGPNGWPRLLGGILGRADDMLVIHGNNIYPSAIEAVVRRFPEIAEFRVTVDRRAPLAEVRFEIETDKPAVAERLGRVIRDELMFRPGISCVPPKSLPRFELKAKRFVFV